MESHQVRLLQVESNNIVEAICDLLTERNTSLEAGSLALICILAAHFVELGVSNEKALELISRTFTTRYEILKRLT